MWFWCAFVGMQHIFRPFFKQLLGDEISKVRVRQVSEWVRSQSFRAASMRVCQPLPVARKAADTSGDKRMVVGTLGAAFTLPVGRPALRVVICSGMCTTASSLRRA